MARKGLEADQVGLEHGVAPADPTVDGKTCAYEIIPSEDGFSIRLNSPDNLRLEVSDSIWGITLFAYPEGLSPSDFGRPMNPLEMALFLEIAERDFAHLEVTAKLREYILKDLDILATQTRESAAAQRAEAARLDEAAQQIDSLRTSISDERWTFRLGDVLMTMTLQNSESTTDPVGNYLLRYVTLVVCLSEGETIIEAHTQDEQRPLTLDELLAFARAARVNAPQHPYTQALQDELFLRLSQEPLSQQ
jgi:hypothetical protein